MSEIIDVYTVDFDGDLGHTESSIEIVKAYLDDMDEDDTITITKRKMEKDEYDKLPEM